jgi:hypothetical protein
MYHGLPRAASFWAFLFTVDQDLADTTRKQGCPCGGHLHCAHYPRKPRGGPETLAAAYGTRLSFCCDRDGCRKRITPPSVRFLGRKVYLGAVVVLVSSMRQGPSPRRVRELTALFGADRQTIGRWQLIWRDLVPQTSFWKVARSRVALATEDTPLPRSLLTTFLRRHADDDLHCDGWTSLLRFLAPITIPGALKIEVSR